MCDIKKLIKGDSYREGKTEIYDFTDIKQIVQNESVKLIRVTQEKGSISPRTIVPPFFSSGDRDPLHGSSNRLFF